MVIPSGDYGVSPASTALVVICYEFPFTFYCVLWFRLALLLIFVIRDWVVDSFHTSHRKVSGYHSLKMIGFSTPRVTSRSKVLGYQSLCYQPQKMIGFSTPCVISRSKVSSSSTLLTYQPQEMFQVLLVL